MANDSDDTLTTAAMLLVGGAAGYGASRWFVGPWLARRTDAPAPSAAPRSTNPTSQTAALPSTTAPVPVAPATSAPVPRSSQQRYAQHRTTPATGPITRPSQVDPSLVDVVGGGAILAPGVYGPPPRPIDYVDPPAASTDSAPMGSHPDPVPIDPYASPPPTTAGPIDPYADPPRTTSGPIDPYADPPTTTGPLDPYAGPTQPPRPLDPYTHSMPSTRLLRAFDTVFHVYRGAIPVEYLRALARRESDMNPRARTGSARGLMQVVPVVLADYNRRHGTRYEATHLDDPAINVGIACELLHIIIASYHRNHPRVRNLQADWANIRFVELLTFGWNAGYSEAGGVGRVTRYLEQHGMFDDVTIEVVHRTARTAGASRHLSNAAKVRWCKSVAALYARERANANPSGVRRVVRARPLANSD